MILQNWGAQSRRDTLLHCASNAEAAGLDSIWVTEQIGLPPLPGRHGATDDAVRSLDPTAVLPFLADATRSIHLGVAVLVASFRHPLLLARWAATLQDLSRGRLELGLGLGFRAHEFAALGLDMKARDAALDEALEKLKRAFHEDVSVWNGEELASNPRPDPPALYVGGSPGDAFDRVIDHDLGWIVTGMSLESLPLAVTRLRELAAGEGRKRPPVACVQTLPVMEPGQALEVAAECAEIGVDLLIHTSKYEGAEHFKDIASVLCEAVRPQLPSSPPAS